MAESSFTGEIYRLRASSPMPIAGGKLVLHSFGAEKNTVIIYECTKSLPGSSSFLVGGIITYSNDVKNNILGVNKLTIAKHGAVSKETAIEMARLVRNKFGSSIGISITGIAGPDGGTDEKPVGTVFIGYADANESTATKFIFGNDRTQNRERAVTQSLLILKERILKNENISN